MKKRAIYWFRNDIRLHDQAGLTEAMASAEEILPVYIFDTRLFEENELGLVKTGKFKTQFLIEAVADLRDNLQKAGSNLLVMTGKPEELLVDLAKAHQIEAIYASQEVTYEELKVEKALKKKLPATCILSLVWQHTLYHLHDLPYGVQTLPDIFTQFRKDVEKQSRIRKCLPTPKQIKTIPINDWGQIPSLESFDLIEPKVDQRGVMPFKGGETAGLERLKQYFWNQDLLKVYKETRNGMLGADYSSKFSPWLALGCLSPRYIYEEVKHYESERISNSSTYWLIFELIWRDYFRFVAEKYGNSLFFTSGVMGKEPYLKNDIGLFFKWAEGETGVPFIDANMRELNATGFMSNRGRQNVASFLVKDLKINWTWGAMYFETMLIDYDPASNWGNWNYAAGVGNDPREDRYFNILTQAYRYDENGDYVRHWLPELSRFAGKSIHDLGGMSTRDFENLQIDYPNRLVDFNKWKKGK